MPACINNLIHKNVCKNCGRTFNDETGTIFAHSKLSLNEWYFAIYMFIQFDTNLRQIEAELDRSYRTVRRHVERFLRALDAFSTTLSGPVKINEVRVSTGLKGCDRDQKSRSRGLPTCGRGSCEGDKPPVFTLVNRGSDDRYVVEAKPADESTVQLLLPDHKEELLTVYTDGFRAYDPIEDDAFSHEYVVQGDGEYADDEVHVNTCESYVSLTGRWLSPHRGVSKDKLTQYLKAFHLRRDSTEPSVTKHSDMLSTPRSENQQPYY